MQSPSDSTTSSSSSSDDSTFSSISPSQFHLNYFYNQYDCFSPSFFGSSLPRSKIDFCSLSAFLQSTSNIPTIRQAIYEAPYFLLSSLNLDNASQNECISSYEAIDRITGIPISIQSYSYDRDDLIAADGAELKSKAIHLQSITRNSFSFIQILQTHSMDEFHQLWLIEEPIRLRSDRNVNKWLEQVGGKMSERSEVEQKVRDGLCQFPTVLCDLITDYISMNSSTKEKCVSCIIFQVLKSFKEVMEKVGKSCWMTHGPLILTPKRIWILEEAERKQREEMKQKDSDWSKLSRYDYSTSTSPSCSCVSSSSSSSSSSPSPASSSSSFPSAAPSCSVSICFDPFAPLMNPQLRQYKASDAFELVYWAPELITGKTIEEEESVSSASTSRLAFSSLVWSIGITVYTILTGQSPYEFKFRNPVQLICMIPKLPTPKLNSTSNSNSSPANSNQKQTNYQTQTKKESENNMRSANENREEEKEKENVNRHGQVNGNGGDDVNPLVGVKCKWSGDAEDFVSICCQKDLRKRATITELLEHPFIQRHQQLH